MEKTFKTIDEQIEILKSRNIIIKDYDKAYRMLSKNNYYYLINGYKDLFIDKTSKKQKYIENTKLEEIYAVYEFDKKIKINFLRYLLLIENEIDTYIAYEFSMVYGHKNYLVPKNFDYSKIKKGLVEKFINDVNLEIQYQYKNSNEMIIYYIDKYKYVIVDNTHDFFNKDNYGVDVIYNYRKYFGVPDGACIVSNDLVPNSKYSKGKSLDKVIEMLSRDETGQYFHYPTFLEADKHFRNEDLCYMSNFTENYLRAIDYETVLKNRLRNYDMLYESLKKYNQLDLSSKQLTYMYPLFVSDGESLRAYLKSNNIYSLRLWANINLNGANSDEITKADNMVLLPIDQRYSDNEIEYIASVIDKYYSNNHNKSKILVRGK